MIAAEFEAISGFAGTTRLKGLSDCEYGCQVPGG
jgi:hypothetical protein